MDDLTSSIPDRDIVTSRKAEMPNIAGDVQARKSSQSTATVGQKERWLKPVLGTKRWTSASMRLRRLRS